MGHQDRWIDASDVEDEPLAWDGAEADDDERDRSESEDDDRADYEE